MAEVVDLDLARSAVALILEGQAPPFEGRVRARMDEARWFDSADDLAGAGVDYFGPVARKARRLLAGFSRGDVADTTNVVWLDLDPPADAGADDAASLVEESRRWLEGLRALGLAPSVFVFSGRGCWGYWKLDRHVPQREAEALMRCLYAQFRPGGSEHDIGRVARMPGSTNEKTGLRAFVMSVEDVRWDPAALGRLLPDDVVDDAPWAVHANRRLRPGGRLPAVELPGDLLEYVASRPPKTQRATEGIDGSSREQAIVSRLVNAGHSDGQIALFFDHHRLPRHEEEKRRRRNYGWLATGIAKARARAVPSSPSASPGLGTYSGEDDGEGYGSREIGWSARRWLILRDMPEALPKLELIAWVRKRYSIGRSQARRELDWLEKEKGYVCMLTDERDRRIKRVHRTDAGRRRLESWNTLGTPLEFLKGRPSPSGEGKPEPEPALDPEPESEPVAPTLASTPRVAVNERLAAKRVELRRREMSLINDEYRIHIPGNRWTYLQLLLPLDEWAKVRLHEQLRVAVDYEGLPVHRSFVSPKDPALGGPDAPDPIEERTLRAGGFPARDRWIGVAAELAETPGGFALATRTENGEELPNAGLLVQSERNFYAPLLARCRRHDRAIAVRKRGRGRDTRYEFMVLGSGIEIPAGLAPDLDGLLDDLADEAEMRAVLESLPDAWPLVRRVPWRTPAKPSQRPPLGTSGPGCRAPSKEDRPARRETEASRDGRAAGRCRGDAERGPRRTAQE